MRGVLLGLGCLVAFSACTPSAAPPPPPAVQAAPAPARPVLGQAPPSDKAGALPVDADTGLVVAEGFELVKGQCTVCHSAKLVIQNRGDEEHWVGLIRWMQKTQGLWPFDEKTEHTIVSYLATHYGAEEGGRRPGLSARLMPPPAPRPLDDAQVQKGKAALGPLKQGLMGTLQKAIQAKGAAGAVDACHLDAPKIAQAASTTVKVGRASERLRNPGNTPPAWAAPLLRSLGQSRDVPYLTADLPGGGLGYVEPIAVGPLCLQCHGTDLAPGVQAELAAKYPDDHATGYAAGDFRGVFWAEVPAG